MGVMVGPILGPVIGGWLTENYNWRWVFYVNVPVGIADLRDPVVPAAVAPERDSATFDLFGFVYARRRGRRASS